MAKFGNRVKETTDSTGTGTLDLGGAPTGFRGFGDEFTSGDAVSYLIVDDPDNPTSYELGTGTFTAGTPDTLSRDTVEDSSNGGNKVSFVAGTKTVIATPTAAHLPSLSEVASWLKMQKLAKGADVASANALTLGDDGNYFDITGTTAITSIGTKGVGTVVKLHFDGALTLTHHATDLILPGGANITTAAGDVAEFVEYATGDWRCTSYAKASGEAVVSPAAASIVAASRGLVVKYATAATVDIDADEIVLKDSSGGTYLAEAVNLTVNITSAGANGLDTGAEATSTWYNVWVIYNPDTDTVAGLLSTSATSPTLPTDYTFKALVGTVYNGSGDDFRRFWQSGRRTSQVEAVVFTGQGTSGAALASQAIAAAVPPIARTATGIMGTTSTGAATRFSVAGDSNGTGIQTSVCNGVASVAENSFAASSPFADVPLMTAQTIYWRENTGTSNRLVVTGYTI